MKVTKRQLRRIIRESLGSSPILTLGDSDGYPTLGNTATLDTFRIPDFGSSAELMKAVEAALGPISPDTPVHDYIRFDKDPNQGMRRIPLSQIYDRVMKMTKRKNSRYRNLP